MRNPRTPRTPGWRHQRLIVVPCLLGWLLAGLVTPPAPAREPAKPRGDSPYENMALFTKVLEQIREYYVETNKTAYKELVYGALKGLLPTLDDHSQFMEPTEYTTMQDDTSGHFGGLGVVISMKDGYLTIVAPMEDTPGFRAGLLAGDRMIEIDGQSTEGLGLSDAVKKLKGKPGTKVKIKIMRPGTQEVKEMEIVRADIKVASVKDARLLTDGIGYLRITQFNEPTAAALDSTMQQFLTNGLTALVIDLRNNPGGLLTSAIEVSSRFLRRGKEIVSTRGRYEQQKQVFRSGGRHHYLDFPMALLVNEGSASAAEIFSGAMQDHHRAVLVGEKTFGKGSVQSVLPLEDGSAVRLTTAKYYTPANRLIHGKGIEPDVVVPMAPEEWADLQLNTNKVGSAAWDERDRQLSRAVDVLKGVMIFQAR